MNDKNDTRTSAQVALALILLALGLMIWDQQGTRSQTSTGPGGPRVYTPETVARINAHLHDTEKKSDLNTLAAEIENSEFLTPPRLGRPVKTYRGPLNPFETEDAAGQVYRDLEPEDGRFESPNLPADRITSLVEQRQWLQKFEERQTKEFIKAVQENARRDGYHLEVGRDLTNVKAKRIPNSAEDTQPSGSR